jgi:hypothetical protein
MEVLQSFNTQKFSTTVGTNLEAQISTNIRTTSYRHKYRGEGLYFGAKNSGMNFEEFGSKLV